MVHHTVEIVRIQDLLKERESSEEESSSSADDPSPGSRDQTNATQDEDVNMEDVKDDSHELGTVGGIDLMTPGGYQPILEGGGATPITPEDDKLLEYEEEEENQAGAITLSGAVAESLSQMNMDSPIPNPPNQ